MSEPKYSDGKYHLEFMEHEYQGGYRQADWTLVNVYGEPCVGEHGTIRFTSREEAERYLDKVNECPGGGVVTNFM